MNASQQPRVILMLHVQTWFHSSRVRVTLDLKAMVLTVRTLMSALLNRMVAIRMQHVPI